MYEVLGYVILSEWNAFHCSDLTRSNGYDFNLAEYSLFEEGRVEENARRIIRIRPECTTVTVVRYAKFSRWMCGLISPQVTPIHLFSVGEDDEFFSMFSEKSSSRMLPSRWNVLCMSWAALRLLAATCGTILAIRE